MMTPAVALNVAVVAIAATVTEAGIVRTARLLESVTAVPPVGAAFDKVTAQGVLALEAREAAVHCSDETSQGAPREIEAVPAEEPIAAVKVADWSEGITPAVAVKLAVT